jgi:hypothetical protein
MAYARQAETAVLRHLDKQGRVTLEELIRALGRFTFNQVFCAVDRLSREGSIVLQRQTRFDYILARRPSSTHTLRVITEENDHGATNKTHHPEGPFRQSNRIDR